MWTCVKYIDRQVGKLTKPGRRKNKARQADWQKCRDKQTGKDRQALETWRKLADRKDTGPQSLVCVNARITEKKEKQEPQGQTVCKPPTGILYTVSACLFPPGPLIQSEAWNTRSQTAQQRLKQHKGHTVSDNGPLCRRWLCCVASRCYQRVLQERQECLF